MVGHTAAQVREAEGQQHDLPRYSKADVRSRSTGQRKSGQHAEGSKSPAISGSAKDDGLGGKPARDVHKAQLPRQQQQKTGRNELRLTRAVKG